MDSPSSDQNLQRKDWETYAREQMEGSGVKLARIGVSLGALFFLFDLAVYWSQPEMLKALSAARSLGLFGGILYLLVVPRSAWVRRHILAANLAAGVWVCVTFGWMLHRGGAAAAPLRGNLLLMPFMTIAFLVPLRQRIVLTLLMTAGLWILDPWSVHPAEIRVAVGLGFSVFVSILSIAVGHAVYFSSRQLFEQSMQLEQGRSEYAELAGRLDERVREQTRDLRALAVHLEQVREDERAHLARELHDELAQLHMAMRIELDLAMKHLGARPEKVAGHLQSLQRFLDELLQRTRTLVALLRPRILDDLGLLPAVEWLLETTRKRSGLHCDLRLEMLDPELTPVAATALFRVLQEALTNVLRHAEAKTVWVHLYENEVGVVLDVRDDGKGIPPKEQRREGAMGLLGMRERITALGGVCVVEPHEEGGTMVHVVVPKEISFTMPKNKEEP